MGRALGDALVGGFGEGDARGGTHGQAVGSGRAGRQGLGEGRGGGAMGERLLRWGVDAVIAVGMAALGVLVLARVPGGHEARAFEAEAAFRQQMAQLETRLDEVEARLLSGLSTVQLWRELAERHESVSQIACENAGEHLREMAAVQKRREKRRRPEKKNQKAEEKAAVSHVADKNGNGLLMDGVNDGKAVPSTRVVRKADAARAGQKADNARATTKTAANANEKEMKK